jgi:tRNA pseudouridine32 synthase/23S rRNA pseudouridine746 synthase
LTSFILKMSQSAGIQALYSDAALLVVNKPAGLSTLPDGYNPTLPYVKSLLETQAGRLWVVHRLDKETSGVLVFARSAQAHRSLNIQFDQHQVSKVYHVLVVGSPGWQEYTVDLPLRPNGDRRHRTVVDLQAGKPAVTQLTVLERLDFYCLVEAIPKTGRTHQIRAHLSSLGLSILGDKLYGSRKSGGPPEKVSQPKCEVGEGTRLGKGMGLHAKSLEINHPISGERLKFEAPYPVEWENILQQSRKQAGSE